MLLRSDAGLRHASADGCGCLCPASRTHQAQAGEGIRSTAKRRMAVLFKMSQPHASPFLRDACFRECG
jgi:hypothetical protein